MPIDPEDLCEHEFTIQFDELGRIHVADPDLARAIVRRALRPEGLEIVVDSAAGGVVLNPAGCPIPIANGCPKPINLCEDSMCPLRVNLRFGETVEESWVNIAENI